MPLRARNRLCVLLCIATSLLLWHRSDDVDEGATSEGLPAGCCCVVLSAWWGRTVMLSASPCVRHNVPMLWHRARDIVSNPFQCTHTTTTRCAHGVNVVMSCVVQIRGSICCCAVVELACQYRQLARDIATNPLQPSHTTSTVVHRTAVGYADRGVWSIWCLCSVYCAIETMAANFTYVYTTVVTVPHIRGMVVRPNTTTTRSLVGRTKTS